jgi:Trk K+ transport system NAD-binding subunit
MSRNVEDWTGHVIVCGLNRVGVRTTEQLHLAGASVVVVDDQPDPRFGRIVRGWGVPQIAGSPSLRETLTSAGLAGAAAVVCVPGDDLQALETALLARELRPDVRVVADIRNPAVGRALAGSGAAVLDVAGLSAPSVVGPCLRTGVHHVDLGGERFVVTDAVAERDGTLRALYGDLAPLAVTPADGAALIVCPGRDHRVGAGDAVTMIGTPAQLREAGLSWQAPPVAAIRSAGLRPRHLAETLLTAVDRRLAFVLGWMVALAALATGVLWLGYREPDGGRMSLVDALYFTVETLATVGYGDFSFRHQPTWLRLFAIGLMVVGVITVTVFFAFLTDLLVSRRIEESLGRRRVTGRSGHVVVIGLGSIGLRVVQELASGGGDVVVVERDETNRYLAQVRAAGVPVLIADATLPDTLRAVNLAEAGGVAVLTSDDLVNLEAGLAVREQLPTGGDGIPVVLRVFDRQLARTVERTFGIGLVRSMAALAAPWFVGAALGLDVLSTFYVDNTPMLVARLTVAPGGGLDGLAMGTLAAGTRVVAISRAAQGGRLEYPVRRETRFEPGDEAYVLGAYQELLHLLGRDRT